MYLLLVLYLALCAGYPICAIIRGYVRPYCVVHKKGFEIVDIFSMYVPFGESVLSVVLRLAIAYIKHSRYRLTLNRTGQLL